VAVYDVDENLTTVLLIVVHTCFYVSFASIDIGLGLVTSIGTSEERRAARHTASTKPKTGPRCPQCSRVCASDFGLRTHTRAHDKTGNT